MHGDGRRRAANKLAGVLVVLILCAVLLAILFVGGRLWWVSFRGPQESPPVEAVTRAPGMSAPAEGSATAGQTSGPAQPSPGMPGTSPEAKASTSTASASVQLAWDRSPDEHVTGYKILFGTQPGNYSGAMSVGNQTTATLTGLERGTKYYIVAVAIDAQGNQSRPSNEIEVVVGK